MKKYLLCNETLREKGYCMYLVEIFDTLEEAEKEKEKLERKDKKSLYKIKIGKSIDGNIEEI